MLRLSSLRVLVEQPQMPLSRLLRVHFRSCGLLRERAHFPYTCAFLPFDTLVLAWVLTPQNASRIPRRLPLTSGRQRRLPRYASNRLVSSTAVCRHAGVVRQDAIIIGTCVQITACVCDRRVQTLRTWVEIPLQKRTLLQANAHANARHGERLLWNFISVVPGRFEHLHGTERAATKPKRFRKTLLLANSLGRNRCRSQVCHLDEKRDSNAERFPIGAR